MDQSHAPTSVKTYLAVFGGLAVLTTGTVLLSYAPIAHNIAIMLAIVIAVLKCSLIAAFFMHLKSESKGIYALLFISLFFVGSLILTLIPDIGIIR